MLIRGLVDEDFLNYKKPSMFIIMPYCDFKCEKEYGIEGICQNSRIANLPLINISAKELVDRYIKNDITHAVVLGGMEPFLSYIDIKDFIAEFRKASNDDIVIYTGYTEEEIRNNFSFIYNNYNIIIKFGRYLPNDHPHFDNILGVELASHNQYAKKI